MMGSAQECTDHKEKGDNNNIVDKCSTKGSWPPKSLEGCQEKCGFTTVELLQLTQSLESQTISMRRTLSENQELINRYKQEIKELQLYTGMNNGTLSKSVMRSFMTSLSNSLAHSRLYVYCNRTPVFDKKTETKSQAVCDSPVLFSKNLTPFCSIDEDLQVCFTTNNDNNTKNIKHTKDDMQQAVDNIVAEFNLIKAKNQSLEQEVSRISQTLQVTSESYETCKKEKEETQSSCRQHMQQHQTKIKERDLEVKKSRKLITELRKTTDQQYKDLNTVRADLECAQSERESSKRHIDDLRRQNDRQHRDLENKDTAIRKLQNYLKDSHEEKLKFQQDNNTEKKRLNKRTSELEEQLQKSKLTAKMLLSDVTKKDQEIHGYMCKMREAEELVRELKKQVENLIKEVDDKQKIQKSTKKENIQLVSMLQEKDLIIESNTDKVNNLQALLHQNESKFILIGEQTNFLRGRLHELGYSNFMGYLWYQDWIRQCKVSPRLLLLQNTCGSNPPHCGLFTPFPLPSPAEERPMVNQFVGSAVVANNKPDGNGDFSQNKPESLFQINQNKQAHTNPNKADNNKPQVKTNKAENRTQRITNTQDHASQPINHSTSKVDEGAVDSNRMTLESSNQRPVKSGVRQPAGKNTIESRCTQALVSHIRRVQHAVTSNADPASREGTLKRARTVTNLSKTPYSRPGSHKK